ncbi:hypothetical protein OS176_14340, partial [Xanthomonadaceae bacterium XH05]|nr:hypothetical protein [Xanthomonadaceae bacterium XH05]
RVLTSADTLKVDAFGSLDFVQKDFKTIENLYNIEFNRDWNLINPQGNQSFVISGVEFSHPKNGRGRYEFQNLNYSENFNGTRHVIASEIKLNKFRLRTNGSLLNSKADS